MKKGSHVPRVVTSLSTTVRTSVVCRISAYIEEEVQRRLQDLHRVIGEGSSASANMLKVS